MIYVIVGPTGSGKTEASLSLAKHFNAPIINSDAFQIYKDMNIGTAKIRQDHPQYKNHYLLDVIPPNESFSVKDYQTLFRKTIDGLLKDNQNIIITGGTGLYIKASLFDYVFEEEQINNVNSDLEKMDNNALWSMLEQLDNDSCQNIHPNNRKRVIRAIQIARTHKINKSENISFQNHRMVYDDVKICFINPPRDELYSNINERVEHMFKIGLVEEVKSLLNKYSFSKTASQAIGYKEVIDYLKGDISFDECKEIIKKRTRNYAKRQITFFKHQFESLIFTSSKDLVEKMINE